jgi:hypothetical protein
VRTFASSRARQRAALHSISKLSLSWTVYGQFVRSFLLVSDPISAPMTHLKDAMKMGCNWLDTRGATWPARVRGTETPPNTAAIHHTNLPQTGERLQIPQQQPAAAAGRPRRPLPPLFEQRSNFRRIPRARVTDRPVEGFGSHLARHGSMSLARGPFCLALSQPLSDNRVSHDWRRESKCGGEKLEVAAGSPAWTSAHCARGWSAPKAKLFAYFHAQCDGVFCRCVEP